ncbi:MAG: hypothetical protein FJZ92_01440 [Chloroflexi bacterium]|nr:hypothetical protein [Chloroflexota bacterium]
MAVLLLACAEGREATAIEARPTTASQDAVEDLIRRGLMPQHERAAARLAAVAEDLSQTLYCVRHRSRWLGGRDTERETCHRAGHRADGATSPTFYDACFRFVVGGERLPSACAPFLKVEHLTMHGHP